MNEAAHPAPAVGHVFKVEGRAQTFRVTSTGNPEKHANTASALSKRGLWPAVITLEVIGGRGKGRFYSALYSLKTGQYQDLMIYPA